MFFSSKIFWDLKLCPIFTFCQVKQVGKVPKISEINSILLFTIMFYLLYIFFTFFFRAFFLSFSPPFCFKYFPFWTRQICTHLQWSGLFSLFIWGNNRPLYILHKGYPSHYLLDLQSSYFTCSNFKNTVHLKIVEKLLYRI